MGCCAYYSGDACLEPYWLHIGLAVAAVDLIKPFYGAALERLYTRLGVARQLPDLLVAAVVLHDAGKLVEEYRRGGRKRYRHEVVSAYTAYRVLTELGHNEEAATVAGLAVLLHHEPITFSALVTGLGYQRLPMMEVYAMVRRSDLRVAEGCDPYETAEGLKKLRLQSHSLADDARTVAEKMAGLLASLHSSRDEIEETLAELVAATGSSEAMRARVAALLHPLVLADQLAAQCSPRRGDGGGTWLTRRALGLDGQPPAEPLPRPLRALCGSLQSRLDPGAVP